MRMDLDVLREFVELSRQLNFRKAADRCYVTQSALSKHIAGMERELGIVLFNRSTTSVELTNAGRTLADRASQIVAEYDEAVGEARACQEGIVGTVRVMGPFQNEQLLKIATTAMQRFDRKYPKVEVVLSDTKLKDYEWPLRDGRYDLAIGIRYDEVSEEEFEFRHLIDLPLCASFSTAHRFASFDALQIEDIDENDTLVTTTLEGREAYHAYVGKILEQHGIAKPFDHRTSDGFPRFPDAERDVAVGIYFSFFYERGIAFQTKIFEGQDHCFDVSLAVLRSNDNPSARLLMEEIILAREEVMGAVNE